MGIKIFWMIEQAAHWHESYSPCINKAFEMKNNHFHL